MYIKSPFVNLIKKHWFCYRTLDVEDLKLDIYLIIVSAINMDVINTSLCLTKYSGHIFGLNYGHESVEFIYK